MNDLDAARIIGLFAAAWPWADWPDPTVLLWQAELAKLEADTGAVAARRCVTDLERPPSLAAFLERYMTERRARQPVVRALPETTTWENPKAHISRLKTMLAEARQDREHWTRWR